MLSGDKREVSVLFCDLRGFTAFAERLPAEEVVAILTGGAELESAAPLSVFGPLQMLLPLGVQGEPETLDGKVIGISDRDGVRTVLVRFTGIGWEMQERIEALARGERAQGII